MKSITIEKPVRDVNGLMKLLQAQDPPFAVLSVGADARRTYLYLDDDEERDPTPLAQEWRDVPELQISCPSPVGHLGAMEVFANGSDVHVLTIKKSTPSGDLLPGNERLSVLSRGPVTLSDAKPRLSEGVVTVEVGPCDKPLETLITVTDPAGRIARASVILRFTRRNPEPPAEAPPIEAASPEAQAALPAETAVDGERPGGIWATLRKILKI